MQTFTIFFFSVCNYVQRSRNLFVLGKQTRVCSRTTGQDAQQERELGNAAVSAFPPMVDPLSSEGVLLTLTTLNPLMTMCFMSKHSTTSELRYIDDSCF